MIGERIKNARQMAGLSLRELAVRVGVTAQAISKYETEKDVPGSDVLLRLASSLGVRVEFFLRPRSANLSSVEFRKKSTLPRKEEKAILGCVKEWLERYYETESLLGIEQDELPNYSEDVSELADAEEAAQKLRKEWKLGIDPIESMVAVLEDHGIKVCFINAHQDFEAVAIHADGSYAVAMNRGVSGDRQRFSLAHELGHIVIPEPRFSSKEKVAHRFAAAFLVPAQSLRNELGNHRTRVTLEELHLLKHKHGMSMGALVYRARDLGIVSESLHVNYCKRANQEGWRRKEPGDEYKKELEPYRLGGLVMRLYNEDVISRSRASELLGESLDTFLSKLRKEHDLGGTGNGHECVD